MVILLSTRGTAGSDIWFMCLADKPMVRGYHLRDYDWTPLNQNPAQKCNDTLSATALGGSNIHGPTLPGHPWWLSHSNTALGQHVLLCWCAEAISIPCNVVVPNHLQTIWFSVTVSYYVEQPPHCDRLRLSLSTGRFVCIRQTHLSHPKLSSEVLLLLPTLLKGVGG